MLFRVVFLWVIFVLVDFGKCSAEYVEAICKGICQCEEEASSNEYRSVCEGDGVKTLILTEKIFENVKIPESDKSVYFRLKNFDGIKFEEGFLFRWLAYTSCSFEVLDSGKVTFPDKVSPTTKPQNLTFYFAGISFVRSSLEKFPKGLFMNRSKIGLNFQNATVKILNLFEMAAKSIQYMTIRSSTIKVFDGNPSEFLALTHEPLKSGANIYIQDSEIGCLSENALAFNDYESKANIRILASTIGIVETSAIKIGKGILLEIEESTLSHVLPSAFSFDDGRSSSSALKRNFIGAETTSMNYLKCDASLQIQDNLFYPKKVSKDCILSSVRRHVPASCDGDLEISNYIDSSCQNNHIIGKNHRAPKMIDLSQPIPSTSSTTQPVPKTKTTTTRPCLPTMNPLTTDYNITPKNNTLKVISSGSENKMVGDSTISFTLFCLVLVLCFSFLLTTVILIVLLTRKNQNVIKDAPPKENNPPDPKVYEYFGLNNERTLNKLESFATAKGDDFKYV